MPVICCWWRTCSGMPIKHSDFVVFTMVFAGGHHGFPMVSALQLLLGVLGEAKLVRDMHLLAPGKLGRGAPAGDALKGCESKPTQLVPVR